MKIRLKGTDHGAKGAKQSVLRLVSKNNLELESQVSSRDVDEWLPVSLFPSQTVSFS
jgi:hypothetical protein